MTRRAAVVLALLLCQLAPVCAADSSATERLMRVADCIRDAGDMKGAGREAFMTQCQAAKDRAAGAGVRQHDVPAGGAAAATVAPRAPPQADGLPPQERILGCAAASTDMQGNARSVFLKECLAGGVQSPVIDAPPARRHAAATPPLKPSERLARSKRCADEARSKVASGEGVMAYMNACMARP